MSWMSDLLRRLQGKPAEEDLPRLVDGSTGQRVGDDRERLKIEAKRLKTMQSDQGLPRIVEAKKIEKSVPVAPAMTAQKPVAAIDWTQPQTAKPPKRLSKKELSPIINKTAQAYGVEPKLIEAIIMAESGGNQYAYRYEPKLKTASLGVGQQLLTTARQLGFEGDPEELYDPNVGTEFIGKYIADQRRRFGDRADLNDPLTVYRSYNTGNPWGNFYPGAEENFRTHYGLPASNQSKLDRLRKRVLE